MENCPHTQETLARYLEGGLADGEQETMREHLASCPACAAALQKFDLVAEVVQDAMVPEGGAQRAAAQISERLQRSQTAPTKRLAPLPGGSSRIRQWAAGAALLLIGVGLGVVFQGQMSKPEEGVSQQRVAIRVAELEGTVLVKHRDTQVWHVLESDSAIYLGDTFHTTATSNLVLALDAESQMQVTQNSMLVLESYDDEIQFYLEHGQCTPVLGGPHGPFFIRTPNGRMEALGTEFTVEVTE